MRTSDAASEFTVLVGHKKILAKRRATKYVENTRRWI
jgi:hypothetical protein